MKTISRISEVKMPQEIDDFIHFLNHSEKAKLRVVTKARVDENLEAWGEIINTFITYPDLLVDLIGAQPHFKLKFSQRVVLRVMSRHRQSFHTFTRGFSKSFLAALSRYIHTMLLPRHWSFIVAETKQQAAAIAKEKITDDIWNRMPFLANEMQSIRIGGQLKKPYLQGKDYIIFNFTHGGRLDVIGTTSSTRGLRRHSGTFEEVITHEPKATNEVILPVLNKEREDAFGVPNPNEPHASKIFVTTAGYQGTFAYDKLMETVCYAVIDPDQFMVLGGSYELPIMDGLLKTQTIRETVSSPSYSEDSFDREYKSVWSGAPKGAAVNYNLMRSMRKIINSELKARQGLNEGEFYVMGADMAKDGAARTTVVVLRIVPKEFSFFYRQVNAFSVDSSNYEFISKEFKKAIAAYNPVLFVYDAQGIGAAMRDWLNKDQRDSDTGEPLPTLGIMNPPDDSKKDIKKMPKHATICYEVKATQDKNSKMYRIFFGKAHSGTIKLLIPRSEAIKKFENNKNFASASKVKQKQKLAPYSHTDILEEEMRNLDFIDTSDMAKSTMKIQRRNKDIQKDYFSALVYTLAITHEIIELKHYNKKRNKKINVKDYIVRIK